MKSIIGNIYADAIATAEDLDSAKLINTLADADSTWKALQTVCNDDCYLPVLIKEYTKGKPRTDVSTITANHKRRKQLTAWLKTDSEDDSRPFGKLYQIELEALNAYAAHALIALYESDHTIMNRIAQLQGKAANRRKRSAA